MFRCRQLAQWPALLIAGLLSAYLASHDILPDSRVNYRQPVFAVRVLRICNSLAEDVVSAAHLSLFISRLVRVNLN